MSSVALREAVRQAVIEQLTKIAQRQKAATFKVHADSILRIASNIADNVSERMRLAEIDDMANDGRLTQVAVRLAIDAGADWPSLDGDAQDAWHERAIEHLRGGGA